MAAARWAGRWLCRVTFQGRQPGALVMLYTFGDDYTLDPTGYELRQHGRLVRLEPRVFDLVTYLVQHANRMVTKEELLEQLWPQQFVTDASLTYCVAQARKAL